MRKDNQARVVNLPKIHLEDRSKVQHKLSIKVDCLKAPTQVKAQDLILWILKILAETLDCHERSQNSKLIMSKDCRNPCTRLLLSCSFVRALEVLIFKKQNTKGTQKGKLDRLKIQKAISKYKCNLKKTLSLFWVILIIESYAHTMLTTLVWDKVQGHMLEWTQLPLLFFRPILII